MDGTHEFFIAPKRYFKSKTEVYWPANERLVGKNHITEKTIMPDETWEIHKGGIHLCLETERDAQKVLNVYIISSTSDEGADIDQCK